jgi:hypothetical protein
MSNNSVYIVLEFILGIALGILSGYLFSLLDNNSSLMDGIFYGMLSLYAAALLGVWLIGYFHLKKTGRLKDFGGAIFFSFIGLIVFLIVSIAIDDSVFIIIVILPVTGAVIGFNFNSLFPKKNKQG